MESKNTNYSPQRAKLIFNPISGTPDQSPLQLMDIITEMQTWNLLPEVYLVEQGCDLTPVVKDAISKGIRLVVVCGGDGTIDVVAAAMVGTRATLGIIPTGTQNNVALSLGIPADIPAAVGLIRNGRRIKVDMGRATSGEVERWFLEACSVGLLSALFPAADDIQHGNLARIGDFLSTLVSTPPGDIRLVLDGKRELRASGHVVLMGNMPYIGPHYQISPEASFSDGLLDVLVFAELSKLDLLGYAVQVVGGTPEDARVQRFKVSSLQVETDPPMPVLIDGVAWGEESVTINVEPRALSVMAGGLQPTEPLPEPDLIFKPETDGS